MKRKRATTARDVRLLLRMEVALRLLPAIYRPPSSADPRRPRRLPSVRAFADASGIHRNTAAAIYRDLERFGLVRCVRGAGTFAVERGERYEPGRASICTVPGLCDILAAEPGCGVIVPAERADRSVGRDDRQVLVPLDETPPQRGRIVPVAPDERSVRALRSLPPHGVVRLQSDSRRLGRLVRSTLHALRRPDVGLERRASSPDGAGRSTPKADLVLIDALEVGRCGTWSPGRVSLPLRLVPGAGARVDPSAG